MGNDTDIASLQEKIDDLNQQAWEARVNDSPKSFELSQESVKLARSINYAKGLAEGLRSLGLGYVRFFKNEEAAPLLRESLSLFQSLNDLKGQGIIYEYLGIIERNFGNLGVSLELLLKGNDLVRQTGPLEVEVTSCYQVGVTYKHLGKHENALDYLYRSISLSKKINFTLMEAYATNIIGSIYFDNGDYNHALDCYQQSLVIRRQSHDKWGEAGSLDNIGFTYLKLNDLDKAIAHCKQSLQITQGTDDKKGEANALLHLAEIYQQAGDIGQASKFSNESFEIRKARGDKRGEAEVLLFLANLHKHENDVNDHQIFDWLSNALKIAEEIKAQDILSKACYNLHEYHTQKGNYKESLVHLEAHLQIEKELHKNTINQKISNLEISHKAETISQRNKELTELNEQIEKANEELKIERSLERVRTAAMAMKEPADMLEVCKIISDQLEVLDVKKIRNVQTAIFYEEKSSYMNYEYYAKHDKLLITEVDYNNHPVAEKFAKQMLKGPNQVWTHGFKGEEVKEWLNYQQSTNVFIDTYLETADSLNYYWYSLGPVALGMSTYAPLNENEIDLFKRFRNVFELAYRRYLDIEKAQAQAREAQIQLALERVRARTMAMQHSNELQETAVLLFQQIKSLNIPTGSCSFNIWDADEPVATVWSSSVEGDLQAPFKLSHTESPIYRDVYASMKRGDEVFVKNVGGEELKKHFVYLTTVPVISDVINKLKKSGYLFPESIIYHFAFFKQGYLSFHVHELQPEAKEVFVRFAKVFEQAYTRFLDLQKAEAQAREAKIEVALERARTQSMIMQHSNELDDTLRVFHEQVLLLGINSAFSFLWLPDEDKNRHIFWAAWAENVSIDPLEKKDTTVFNSKAINYPLDRNEPATAQCLIDWKGKEPVVSYHVPPDGVESYFATWQELISGVAQLKPEYFSNGLYYVEAFMKYGCFGVMVESELSEDEKKILLRFSIEFERTYTRFLDLQKSEAQARDAQIEVALERIRSKVMAMSSSKDLDETSLVFGEQLRKLGIDWQFSYFWLIDEAKNENTFWITWPDYKTSLTKYTLAEAEEYFSDCLVAWRGGVKIHDNYVPPSDVQPWLDTFQRIADDAGGVAKEVMQFKNFVNGVYYYDAMMRYGSFGVLYNRPSTDEEKNIQCRFAIEFERAYTRFLDLKNAEAQVREAQIQLALERVRARTMAMHSSKELDSIIKTVYSELKKLDVLFELCFIMIFDEHKGATWWMGSPDDDLFHEGFYVPYHTHPPHLAYLQGWEERQQKWEYWLGGQIKKDWDDFVFTKTELSKLPPIIIQAMKSYDAANLAASFESFGCMTIGGRQRLSEESFNILSRFAKVFDLSYTRFRDLQKAEAQAREAQIELGLERVRARAMAMQKSDELSELVDTVFKELTKLDFALAWCIINIIDGPSLSNTVWAANPDIHKAPDSYHMKFEDYPFHDAMMKGYKEKKTKYIYVLEGEEKKVYDEYLFKETEFRRVPEEAQAASRAMEKYVVSFTFGNFGGLQTVGNEPLSDINLDILERFGKVFDLTYTRFNDLLKAEAQAREARIGVGLERVRSRSLAMHNTSELQEVIHTVHKELLNLNIAINGGSFIAINKDVDKVLCCWGSGGTAETSEEVRIPLYEHPFCTNLINRIKSAPGFFIEEYTQKEKKDFFTFLFKHEPWSKLDAKQKDETLSSPGGYTRSCYVSQHTSIFIINHFGKKFSAADNDILQRFGKVF
ncbi:MAG TPA: tetratricopeptide repeat protein, partial [Chitinophagaceae bacterium]|nr:tetratricopeptide repeat protein [Chitinophagaceae bacterium]